MDLSISSEFITLGQFLKLANQIDSGGQAKWFLETHPVYVNGELENRRGRKIMPGDKVMINGETYHCVSEMRSN